MFDRLRLDYKNEICAGLMWISCINNLGEILLKFRINYKEIKMQRDCCLKVTFLLLILAYLSLYTTR